MDAREAAGSADAGLAAAFDPGHGRPMKRWVSVAPDAGVGWEALAREALTFARGGELGAALRDWSDPDGRAVAGACNGSSVESFYDIGEALRGAGVGRPTVQGVGDEVRVVLTRAQAERLAGVGAVGASLPLLPACCVALATFGGV